MTNRSEHPLKKAFLTWTWRIQQPGMIFNIVMSAINMTLLVNIYMKWRFNNPYVGILLAFGLVMSVLLIVAWLWDAKARMWHEQTVVGAERNPYFEFKMTPKEIFCNEVLWIPLFEAVSDLRERFDPKKPQLLRFGAQILKQWNKEQLEADPVLRKRVEKIREHFKHGNT